MKYLFLLGALLAWATPSMAQCGCSNLWLAMDDTRQYEYSYRVAKGGDTTAVGQLASAMRSTRFGHKSAADRPHVQVQLPSYQTTSIQVDVTDRATHQQMQLTFESHGLDATYRLLFDFVPGSQAQVVLGRSAIPFAGFEAHPTKVGADGTYWLKLHRK